MLWKGLVQGQKSEARSARQGLNSTSVTGGLTDTDLMAGDAIIGPSSLLRGLSASEVVHNLRRKSSHFCSTIVASSGERVGLLEADAAQQGYEAAMLMSKSDVDQGRSEGHETVQSQTIDKGEAGGMDEEAIALLVVHNR